MFDCVPMRLKMQFRFNPELITNLKTIKLHGHCCRCGGIIPLFWNNDLEIDGDFMCDDSSFSDLWGNWLPDANKLVCRECWSFSPKRA